jgi:hypothetical protein
VSWIVARRALRIARIVSADCPQTAARLLRSERAVLTTPVTVVVQVALSREAPLGELGVSFWVVGFPPAANHRQLAGGMGARRCATIL